MLPLVLESTSDQPIVGVDSPIATLSSLRLVAGAFHFKAPGGERALEVGLQLLYCHNSRLHPGRRQCGQEALGHCLLDAGAADAEAAATPAVGYLAGAAVVAGDGVAALVGDQEVPTATPA